MRKFRGKALDGIESVVGASFLSEDRGALPQISFVETQSYLEMPDRCNYCSLYAHMAFNSSQPGEESVINSN